jgi:hypothetical protein
MNNKTMPVKEVNMASSVNLGADLNTLVFIFGGCRLDSMAGDESEKGVCSPS